MNSFKKWILLTVTVLSWSGIQAQEEPAATDVSGDYATGSWGGARNKMADNGVALELGIAIDYFYNASGGVETGGNYLENLDLTLDLDMGSLVGWNGAEFFFYGLGNAGASPTEYVGDMQGTSNIETGMEYFKLYEAWFQQNLLDDKISLLFGIHDLNSEFYANDPAGLFLNSSQGIGTEIAQTGANGPSIFPVAGLAARLMIQPVENVYISAAAYDAVAGDPDAPDTTYVDFEFNDGALAIGEAGYYIEGDIKLAAGYWQYTEEIITMKDAAPSTGAGYYVLADKTLADIFSLFFRIGMASADVYEVDMNVAYGFTVVPAFMGREDDMLGLGVTTARLSPDFSDFLKALGETPEANETTIEFTYLLQLTPWFSLQPNVQYVMNPSASSTVDDATVFMLRCSILF